MTPPERDTGDPLAAVAGDVAAAQRHQFGGPQPGAYAEHHHGER